MKKIKINILLFLAPICILAILNLTSLNKESMSAIEMRSLKSRPQFTVKKLFSGDFFREYDEYFADNFIFRSAFIDLNNRLKVLKGINNEEGIEIFVSKGINVAQRLNPQSDDENVSDENNGVIDNADFGKVLVIKDIAMELHIFNEKANKNYANTLNLVQEKLKKISGEIKVYSILVPTQVEFIKDEKYRNISSSQKETIEFVNENLNKAIIPVNVYDTLKERSTEYIYFRTDHHWTALGAYYAYTSFIKTSGEEPISLLKYKKTEVTGYLGTTYAATLSERLKKNPDKIKVYQPFISHQYSVYYEDNAPILLENVINMDYATQQSKYGIFMSGDHPLAKVTTSCKNGKKIVIIKDSYANAFIPYLIPHYEEIYIIDPRQYKGNLISLVKDNDIQEVLFLNYVLVNRYEGYSELFSEFLK